MGIVSTSVGYTGGSTSSPSYREVCDAPNSEGHTEAIRVVFDPSVITFEDLMRRFFEEAMPNVRRLQYRSAVWAQNAVQMETATRIASELHADGVPVLEACAWHEAEPRHQKYYENQAGGEHVCRRLL